MRRSLRASLSCSWQNLSWRGSTCSRALRNFPGWNSARPFVSVSSASQRTCSGLDSRGWRLQEVLRCGSFSRLSGCWTSLPPAFLRPSVPHIWSRGVRCKCVPRPYCQNCVTGRNARAWNGRDLNIHRTICAFSSRLRRCNSRNKYCTWERGNILSRSRRSCKPHGTRRHGVLSRPNGQSLYGKATRPRQWLHLRNNRP